MMIFGGVRAGGPDGGGAGGVGRERDGAGQWGPEGPDGRGGGPITTLMCHQSGILHSLIFNFFSEQNVQLCFP